MKRFLLLFLCCYASTTTLKLHAAAIQQPAQQNRPAARPIAQFQFPPEIFTSINNATAAVNEAPQRFEESAKRASSHMLQKTTLSIFAILFVAAALVFLYHDHTKAAQITTPLPTVRFIDRCKKHLFSKHAGFFCLGALAYRQLCV